MLKFLPTLFALAALGGCQPQQPATEKPAPPTVAAPPTLAGAQCYAYAAQDTVYLTLTSTPPTATGNLIYHYAGKDRNRGTLRGTLARDTLRADYTFTSESVASVREVVFVKRGAGWSEGYGPVAERAGKTVFQHPHQLKFDTLITLKPVQCKGR